MSGHTAPAEFAGFLEHAREGRLAFPRCAACGRFHWYPMPVCPHCQNPEIDWTPVPGAGEIFSFTTVRHAFDPRRRDRLPYVVALVTFDHAPGVRLITNIVDSPHEAIAIGRAVEAVLPPAGGGDPPVLFRLVAE